MIFKTKICSFDKMANVCVAPSMRDYTYFLFIEVLSGSITNYITNYFSAKIVAK